MADPTLNETAEILIRDCTSFALDQISERIQEALGIKTGDLAGIYWTGKCENALLAMVREYFMQELRECEPRIYSSMIAEPIPEATLALIDELRAKYPAHDFRALPALDVNVSPEDDPNAPAFIICWTHEETCCYAPFMDGWDNAADPEAVYGIERADAEHIRDHNNLGA
jgi:hypothetical protein